MVCRQFCRLSTITRSMMRNPIYLGRYTRLFPFKLGPQRSHLGGHLLEIALRGVVPESQLLASHLPPSLSLTQSLIVDDAEEYNNTHSLHGETTSNEANGLHLQGCLQPHCTPPPQPGTGWTARRAIEICLAYWIRRKSTGGTTPCKRVGGARPQRSAARVPLRGFFLR